jgi:hypothetical protein
MASSQRNYLRAEGSVTWLDIALLEPPAQVCAEEQRDEFMFVALPLKIPWGTGSRVNPIALF